MEPSVGRLKSYEDLVVWRKAMGLVIEVYRATSQFPREEMYDLTSQLRRSAVSVPSNIAEGQGRATKGEFVQFLANARGSLYELKTQTLIAKELGFLSPECQSRVTSQADEVGRMWNGLLTSLGGTNRKLTTRH
jgi:four helix bundle protein